MTVRTPYYCQKTGASISEVLRQGLRSYDTTVNGIRLGDGTGETIGEAFGRIMERYGDPPQGPTQSDERAALPPRRHKEAVVAAIRERHAR